jgi:hypothetical protein
MTEWSMQYFASAIIYIPFTTREVGSTSTGLNLDNTDGFIY